MLAGGEAYADHASLTALIAPTAAEALADVGACTPVEALLTHQCLKRFIHTSTRTKPAWPVTTITGPCVNPYFRNTTADKTLVWNVTLTGGQELVVDHRLGICTIDGDALATGASPTVSGFFQILPGENIFEIGGDEIIEGSIEVALPNEPLGS